MPAIQKVEKVLKRTLRQGNPQKIDYYNETLDVSRFTELHYRQALYEFLCHRYRGQGIDLMVAVGQSAAEFAAQYGAKLFPGTPVVFYGTARFPLAPNFTGLYQTLDMKSSLDLALQLQPVTQQVFVVSGVSNVDKLALAIARQQFQQFDGRLAFTYLTGLPPKDLCNALGRLPCNSIIYFVTFSEDNLGNRLIATDVLEELAAARAAPIYGFNEAYLSRGLVGGCLLSPEILASRLGELALRILRGEKPANIPATEVQDYVTVVDWRQLQRWGILEDRLPPGTAVRFKEPTFWEHYKWQIVGVLTLCTLEGLLISILLIERAGRRRARAQLDERLRFERLVSELSAEFTSLRAGEIDEAIEKWVLRLKEFLGANNGVFFKLEEQKGGDGDLLNRAGVGERFTLAGNSSGQVAQSLDTLRQGNNGNVTRVGEEDRQEKTIESLPAIPIEVDGSKWTLTFANPQSDGTRSKDLVPRLRLVCQIFAAAAMRKRSDTALRESEARNRAILQALPDLMFLQDRQGVYLDYYASSTDLLYVPPEKFLGRKMQEVLPLELAQLFTLKLEEAAKSSQPVIVEYSLPISGKECFHEARIARCAGDKFLTIVRDRTARRQAEEALRKSQERYRLATSAARIGVWDWNLQTGETYVDPLSVIGYEDDEILTKYGDDSWQFIHPDDVSLVREQVNAHLSGQLPQLEVEHRALHKDGSIRWFRVRGRAIKNENGKAIRMVGTTADVTERKQAEETLRKSEERLRLSLEAGRMGAWDWDVKSNAVFWSHEIFSILGLDPSKVEPSYQNWVQRVHPADRPLVEDAVNQAVRERRDYQHEYRIIWPDGSLRWVHDYAKPVYGGSGECIAMTGLVVDMTERKQAEEELRASEQRYRDVVETQTELICRYRPDTTLTFVNEAYCRYFGMTSQQLVGSKFIELIPELERPAATEHVASLIANPRIETNEHRVIKADGSEGWQQWVDHVIRDADGRVVELQGIGHDITDRKQVEDDLVQLSVRFLGLQNEERQRIARELHDVTAQNLFAATIGLARLQQTKLISEAQGILAECQGLCEQALKEIRTLSYRLHPPMLDQAGLVPALQWYIAGFAKRTGIDVGLVAPREIEGLPKEMEADLFRIVQESLANVHRHSGSSTATVRLDRWDSQVALEIIDHGQGMAGDANGPESLGVGIRGMRERLRQLGGRLEVVSSDQGTTIRAIVPLSARQALVSAAAGGVN
jgi:PAS domain S-box-containing protein